MRQVLCASSECVRLTHPANTEPSKAAYARKAAFTQPAVVRSDTFSIRLNLGCFSIYAAFAECCCEGVRRLKVLVDGSILDSLQATFRQPSDSFQTTFRQPSNNLQDNHQTAFCVCRDNRHLIPVCLFSSYIAHLSPSRANCSGPYMFQCKTAVPI